jgi:hypothetical protein
MSRDSPQTCSQSRPPRSRSAVEIHQTPVPAHRALKVRAVTEIREILGPSNCARTQGTKSASRNKNQGFIWSDVFSCVLLLLII